MLTCHVRQLNDVLTGSTGCDIVVTEIQVLRVLFIRQFLAFSVFLVYMYQNIGNSPVGCGVVSVCSKAARDQHNFAQEDVVFARKPSP
jgi:hypothetical protein